MTLGPLELRDDLHTLLERVDADPRLDAEMSRARREFFGADEPVYVHDEAGLERAAVRFAEWFLLERESDVWGETPVSHLPDDGLRSAGALGNSLVGVFIVEVHGDELLRVRDLQNGTRLELTAAGERLSPGDLLVGRIYELDDGSMVPSAVVSILSASPEVAVAFQRDIKSLGLDRRLSQAELEHLLYRNLSALEAPAVPLEHLEAELQTVLEDAGADEQYPVTMISEALRGAPGPGTVSGPLLDELAFETEVDLERLRRLLIEIWNAHQSRPAPSNPEPADPPAKRPGHIAFEARPDETLGQRLARRIEEGLAQHEDVEAMFEDVEQIFGEDIDEPEAEETEPDPGDLELLIREFAWERGAAAGEETTLSRFAATQRNAPIPRVELEYLSVDDLHRFLLETWLGTPPDQRVTATRAAHATLVRFCEWAIETQGFDGLRDAIDGTYAFVEDFDRLQAASLALSTTRDPSSIEPGELTLMQVIAVAPEGVVLAVGEERREVDVSLSGEIVEMLCVDDLLFGAMRSAPSPRPHGVVVAVPGALHKLLG